MEVCSAPESQQLGCFNLPHVDKLQLPQSSQDMQ